MESVSSLTLLKIRKKGWKNWYSFRRIYFQINSQTGPGQRNWQVILTESEIICSKNITHVELERKENQETLITSIQKVLKEKLIIIFLTKYQVDPYTLVARKIAEGFRRFQDEGVEFFFNRTSLTPLRFLVRIFWKIPILALTALICQWVFITRSCFWVRWFYSLFERIRLKRKKRCLFTLTNLESHHFI